MEGQEDGAPEQSRLAIFEFHPGDEVGAAEVKLEPLGQWHFDGPADSVGVFGDSDSKSSYPHLPLLTVVILMFSQTL